MALRITFLAEWQAVIPVLLMSVGVPLAATPFAAEAAQSGPATCVYVSLAPEQQVRLFQLDAQTGELALVDTVRVDGSPGALAVDPARKFLYASLRSTSRLAAFRRDSATGKLQPLNSVALPPGENAAFVATDRSGKWLLSASYAAGRVVVHRLDQEGRIEARPVQTIDTAKTAHCVAVDRENQWVFVPHVAPNAVMQFRWDPTLGRLTAAGQAPGGSPQAGPRHLAFHPTRNLAFTSDESGSSVTSYRFDPQSGLQPLQTVSTLPADFQGKNSTAEVKVHPSGRYVWVSNRGHDSLARFAIDAQGRLTPEGHTPTEKTPRSFEIDPSGRFLFGAGEGSGKLAVYQVDPDSGQTAPLRTYDVGQSLAWVMAVPGGR